MRAFLIALSLLIATPALAGEGVRVISVPKNKSAAFRLDAPAGQIVVSQPDTAEIVATTDHSFYVRGKQVGATNLLVYGRDKRLAEVIDVRVGYDAAEVENDLRAILPAERISVRAVGDGLLLSGEASTTGVANRAKALAERYAPQKVNSVLTVRGSEQIVLEVRVMEATRSSLQDFGIDMAAYRAGNVVFGAGSAGLIGGSQPAGGITLSGGHGGTTFDATLRVLEEKGVIRMLARPNLVALSGEKASFLAGGEFPYPVPEGRERVVIQFRPFGVRLDFEPRVQDNGMIRLQVAPEVSQLDPSNSLRLANFTVPALTTRKVATVVELREGESFAIAGLFQQDYVNAVRQIPGAGKVPVLGALFRSSRWKRNETELLIVVTPRMATASDLQGPATTPFSAGAEPSPIDLILMGDVLDKDFTQVKPDGSAG